jgi:hypothetical protein
MAPPTRIGGVLNLKVDGVQYQARGNFTVTPGTVKRTGVAGQDAVHGYIEEPIVPSIKGDISIGNGLSIQGLEDITAGTAQCQLANGRTYVLSQCWCVAGTVVDTHDGKADFELQGVTCSEI